MRGDIAVQTRNVLDAITVSLVEHGVARDSVIRATVWLSVIKLMTAFNEGYRTYFADHLPVRSTVEAKLSQDVDVEIEVTAWAPGVSNS
ncbi:Enamine/imine deaminase (fragment) (plasmid) [Cupriavidus taiwanensis]|uniref:Enamine/imine deaminase n=1 Tax=Cupriavidus taiwanensis TaxID=164546 RepID=A0A7Z7JIR1_9BURK